MLSLFLELNADRTARHAAVLHELIVNTNRGGRRHGKTNTLIAAAAGQNSGVDADDLSGHIDKRAAGISGINGRVGLQEALELVVAHAVAILGADDAGGNRGIEPEGAANRENPIAHLDAIGVAKLGKGQDPYQRQS